MRTLAKHGVDPEGQLELARTGTRLSVAHGRPSFRERPPRLHRERAFDDAHAGFVAATIDELTSKKFTSSKSGKARVTYTVRCSYTVDGKDYSNRAACPQPAQAG